MHGRGGALFSRRCSLLREVGPVVNYRGRQTQLGEHSCGDYNMAKETESKFMLNGEQNSPRVARRGESGLKREWREK